MNENTNKLSAEINNMPWCSIDILLSTYNGSLFIKDQIESLLEQTNQNWRLIVRDDGSLDNTIEIVKNYAASYPSRITLIEDGTKHLGACQSYARLLGYSKSDYIMFCDQDDVWLPKKIEDTFAKMSNLEERYSDAPILVHTDLKVANRDLQTISESLWRYQKLNPNLQKLNVLLIQNNVTGCSMMINRKLLDMATPIPFEAVMHDWWIALVASAFGKIGFVNDATLLYRQHGENEIGAKEYSLHYYTNRIKKLNESITFNKQFIAQSEAFFLRYSDKLPNNLYLIVQNFSILFNLNRLKRLFSLLKIRVRKHSILGTLGFYTVILLARKENDDRRNNS